MARSFDVRIYASSKTPLGRRGFAVNAMVNSKYRSAFQLRSDRVQRRGRGGRRGGKIKKKEIFSLRSLRTLRFKCSSGVSGLPGTSVSRKKVIGYQIVNLFVYLNP